MNEVDPEWFFHPKDIAERSKARGQWDEQDVRTPEKTVLTYFSENKEIFEVTGTAEYRLREAYRKKAQ